MNIPPGWWSWMPKRYGDRCEEREGVKKPAHQIAKPKPVDMAPAFRHLSDELARRILRVQQECGSHTPATSRWYCWQSHVGAEFVAFLELDAQGFIPFLPMICDRLRPATARYGRTVVQPPPILPLFTGYGFVSLDLDVDRWRCISSTRGIRRLFSYSPEAPMPVPAGVVEGLIRRMGVAGYIDDDRPAEKLAPIEAGSEIVVLDGPFASLRGICRMSESQRVMVLLNVMGSAPVSLPRSSVAKVA